MSQQPPWKRWYKTARWRAPRLVIFPRDGYTCQCDCGQLEGDTSLLICDHRMPHRGDDEAKLQTLRKRCHDGAKQKAEQATLHTRGVWY